MAGLTAEEATIKAAIEARLATLREAHAEHLRQASAHQQAAQQHSAEALKLSGAIPELEAIVGYIVPAERPARKPRTPRVEARAGEPGTSRVVGELPPPLAPVAAADGRQSPE